MDTEEKTEGKGGNAAKQDARPCTEVSKSEPISISECPECGGPLRFGSRDLAEGDYWWCSVCGYGPIKFSLFCGPPVKQVGIKELLGIIDADKANEALRIVEVLKARPPRKRPVIIPPPVPSPHAYLDGPLDNLGNWKNHPEVK